MVDSLMMEYLVDLHFAHVMKYFDLKVGLVLEEGFLNRVEYLLMMMMN